MSPRSTQQTPRATSTVSQPWLEAVKLISRFVESDFSASVSDELGSESGSPERAQEQRLVLGVLRNTVRLMGSMAHLAPRMPRKKTLAILLTAGFELMEARDDGERARITHHAVEGAKALVSDREVAFVNAVLHRLPGALAAEVRADLPPTVHLAFTYSHPAELVERWVEEFGEAASAKLLRWNQEPAPMYVRMEPGVAPIDGLTPTKWPDFYEVGEVDRASLHKLFDAREAYAQDPFTRHPVDLLDPQPGENVLDLCSAPGGKARLILPRMGGSGTLVCIESNERRVARLRENVPDRDEAPRVRVLHAALGDLTPEDLEAAGLPGLYDAVLIDVPCSNSGVIRRRPEARWRQSDPQLMNEVVAMQTLLLDLALKFVRPGGRIVYSTCSIDARENSGVVDLVLKGLPDVEAFKPHPEFRLAASRMSYPWIDGHDGGGAFRLERVLDA